MNDENYLEMIEQLRHDRDKYIGMWRSQCQITEQVMKERDAARASTALDVIDRLMAELAEVREEYGHKCAKCGSVLQLVRPGKYQCQYCEMEGALTAELARYKQGVEVEVESYLAHMGIDWIELPMPKQFRGQRIRVLVMKEEE